MENNKSDRSYARYLRNVLDVSSQAEAHAAWDHLLIVKVLAKIKKNISIQEQ